MSNREKIPEWIDRFNNGELSGEELTTLLEMARNDPRLREEIKLDKELNTILSEEDLLDLRKKILILKKQRSKRKGNNLKLYLIAASLFLFIGIGLVILSYRGTLHSNAKSGETTGVKDTHPQLKQLPAAQRTNPGKVFSDTAKMGNNIVREQKGTNLLASFVKNPSLENLIGTTRNSENFVMVFPVNDHHFSANAVIRFEWILEGQGEIELRIMNNSGISVCESGMIRKDTYSIPPGRLKRGLFYFKILRGDEILYFGKFTIK